MGTKWIHWLRTDGLPYVGLLIVSVVWGVTWPVGKVLATSLPTFTVVFLRLSVATPCLFVALRIREGPIRFPKRSDRVAIAVISTLSIFLYQTLYMLSVTFTAASDAVLVGAVSPTVVSVLSIFLLNDPMDVTRIAGLVFGLLGVALIAVQSEYKSVSTESRLLGDFCVFLASIVYSVYTVLMKRYFQQLPLLPACCCARFRSKSSEQSSDALPMKDMPEEPTGDELDGTAAYTDEATLDRINKAFDTESTSETSDSAATQALVDTDRPEDSVPLLTVDLTSDPSADLESNTSTTSTAAKPEVLSPLALLAWSALLGALMFAPLTPFEKPWEYEWHWTAWLLILQLGLGSTCIGFLLNSYGIKAIGAARATIFGNFVPVVGVISSWLILGEPLSWVSFVSLALVWLGVLSINLDVTEHRFLAPCAKFRFKYSGADGT